MPITKRPLTRYEILDRCLSNKGRRYTFDDLREAIDLRLLDIDPDAKGISVRQLRDDIAFMKSSQGWEAPIVHIPGQGKKRYYIYEDPDFSINKRPVNETQVQELNMALDVLGQFEGMPQFDWIKQMMIRLEEDRELASNKRTASIIDWGGNPYYKGIEYLPELYRATSERKQIELRYEPFGKPELTFVTNPLYLKQYNNRWFLIAMLEEDGFVYINGFDRINNLVVLDTAIPENITFDAEEYFDPIVGVSRPEDGELEEIEIQLTSESYPYVKTKPIHHSQINYDEECKVKIRVIRNMELEIVLNKILL